MFAIVVDATRVVHYVCGRDRLNGVVIGVVVQLVFIQLAI